MPTYEYACRDCGEHLEVVQSFRDDPLRECPGCSGRLRKVFSPAGIVLKGGGWHIKEYSSTSRPPGKDGKGKDGKPKDGRPGDGRPGDGKAGDGKAGEAAGGADTTSAGGSSGDERASA